MTGELYVGTRPASIFKSLDSAKAGAISTGSARWRGQGLDLRTPPYYPHVKGIGLARGNPNVILGAIEEGWLVRSTDGGASWANLTDGPEFNSHTISAMPDNENVLISTSGKGVFRSEDGGDHFAPANNGLHSQYLAQLAFHPDEPRLLFTAGAEAAAPAIARSRPEGCRSLSQQKPGTELAGAEGRPAQRHAGRAARRAPRRHRRARLGHGGDAGRRALAQPRPWASRSPRWRRGCRRCSA